MSTPTPGELSARLQALSDACLSRRLTPAECGEFHDCIAALSALPAGGEPLKVFSEGPWLFEETGQRFTGREMDEAAFAVYRATPPPDAAHPDDGCLDCLRKERGGDAAVGAQGDRLRNAYLRDMEDTLRQLHAIVGMDSPDVDALIEKVRRLAAPAAGKGVDDAMVIRAENAYFDALPPSGGEAANPVAMRAALAAALTRQPVAGDGMVLVPREPTPAMLIPLVHRSFTDHWEAGKQLQSEQLRRSSAAGNYGYQDWMIPPKTEYEVAAGQYLAMLAAAPTGPAQGDGADTPADGGEG